MNKAQPSTKKPKWNLDDSDELSNLLNSKKIDILTQKHLPKTIKFPSLDPSKSQCSILIKDEIRSATRVKNKIKTKAKFSNSRVIDLREDRICMPPIQVKCESVDMVNKFSNSEFVQNHISKLQLQFPYDTWDKVDEIVEENYQISKNVLGLVKPKIKSLNMSVKLPEKVKKICKSNLSGAKYKELISRNVHEFWEDSKFNQLLRNFNDFIVLINEKIDSRGDINYVLEACRKLGIKVQKTQYAQFYMSTDFIDDIKAKVLENFLKILNDTHELEINCDVESAQLGQYTRNNGFKAFVEKGNNGTVVKTVLNRRSWWSIQDTHDENYESSDFIWTQWTKSSIIKNLSTTPENVAVHQTYNKIEGHACITNKKDLFLNLTEYYKKTGEDYSECIPLTFLIDGGKDSSSFQDFRQYFTMTSALDEEDNKWICKPGENSNRGQNIWVHDKLDQIENYVETGTRSWFIVQKYIHNPLLINKRKFDIRCFALLTSINGKHQGYFYQDGYLRTAWKEYSSEDIDDLFIHLTNDAIQKKCEEYGKYESSNKISFLDFEKYLEQNYPEENAAGPGWFYTHIYPQIKKLVRDTFMASRDKINPNNRFNWFELYGYDFMITDDFKVSLIEVNTNPCLEIPCSLLSRIIASVLDNTYRIALDSLTYMHNSKTISLGDSTNNLSKFELIYTGNSENDIS